MPDCTYRRRLEENEDKVKILTLSSTETVQHSFRQVAFFISWSESTSQVTCLLTKLSEFLKTSSNMIFYSSTSWAIIPTQLYLGVKRLFIMTKTLKLSFSFGKEIERKKPK